MWCLLRRLSARHGNGIRSYLSESFGCQESWAERLQSPILKKAPPEELFRQLEQSPQVSALDVDVLANASRCGSQMLDEVEEAVHRLRIGPQAAAILPSTGHAFVRLAVDSDHDERLLNILDDRLNYGLFLDDYCTLLLLDRYLKNGSYREAAKVAALRMLQEDFDSPLIAHMSLLASYRYALNPSPWTDAPGQDEGEKNEGEDEEEEIKVRVKYIRNPYFDDHFDLREGPDLVGKSLMLAGHSLADQLGDSFCLVGAALYGKWEAASDKLLTLADSNRPVYAEAVEFVKGALEKHVPKQGDGQEVWNGVKSRLQDHIQRMEKGKLLGDGDMAVLAETRIKNLVQKEEKEIIAQQKKIYKEWIEQRENFVMKLVEETRREQRLAKVKQAKEELEKREEELFFFDREDGLDLKIENKKVVYPKKWTGRKKKKRSETADYVPPVVS